MRAAGYAGGVTQVNRIPSAVPSSRLRTAWVTPPVFGGLESAAAQHKGFTETSKWPT